MSKTVVRKFRHENGQLIYTALLRICPTLQYYRPKTSKLSVGPLEQIMQPICTGLVQTIKFYSDKNLEVRAGYLSYQAAEGSLFVRFRTSWQG